MSEETLSLKNVSHHYGWQWALIDISFSLRAGESLVVVGPNGCGKSTLLKILATRLTPTKGEAILLGFDLKRDFCQLRQQTEWLGHELGLYSRLTAEENLRFSFAIRGEKLSPSRIAEVLKQVDLISWKDRVVAEFSSGMRKRLAIARILAGQPRIVVLDEPHANLDQEGKVLMNQCMEFWKKVGTSLFLASHDHHEVLPLCHRVLVLNQGRLVFFGEPSKIPPGEFA